ncbi:MAG: metallophosphoesterase family protein, partial [Anaerolineae bacterium]
AERHRLTLEGRSAVMVHGHRRGELRSLINEGKHAYVIHGHTHRRRDETIGPTRVINPGALGGMRWQQRSFCILDLDSDRVTFIEI